jgi:hypothetical protein
MTRWLLSWILYWLGDAISRPMRTFDWAWLHRSYKRAMLWSADIQGTGKGPWGSKEYRVLSPRAR